MLYIRKILCTITCRSKYLKLRFWIKILWSLAVFRLGQAFRRAPRYGAKSPSPVRSINNNLAFRFLWILGLQITHNFIWCLNFANTSPSCILNLSTTIGCGL